MNWEDRTPSRPLAAVLGSLFERVLSRSVGATKCLCDEGCSECPPMVDGSARFTDAEVRDWLWEQAQDHGISPADMDLSEGQAAWLGIGGAR